LISSDTSLSDVRLGRTVAADIGIERVEPMNQSLLLEEVERPVHGHRSCGALAGARQLPEDVIRADGVVAAPDDLEHRATKGRQSHQPLGA
jgi:hypothetical protein